MKLLLVAASSFLLGGIFHAYWLKYDIKVTKRATPAAQVKPASPHTFESFRGDSALNRPAYNQRHR